MSKRASRNPRVAVVRHGTYGEPHPRRDIFALRDAGFDVDFICDSEPGKPHIEYVDGVTVIRMPLRHKRGRLGRYIFEYTAAPLLAGAILALRSTRRRYDYVEIDTMPTWLIAAAAVPKLLGSTVVLYMFEHMAELHATDTGHSERHWHIRLLDAIETACVRAADTVLTPAERNRELYISRGIAGEKIIFIPNCPDERLFLAGTGDVEEMKSAGRNEEFRLVTHGTLLERYGIQLLLAAVARLRGRIPGLRLEVIGSGEYESALKTEARRLEIQDLVEFTGPVPFERVAARLLEADLGVGPYLLDLLPNKMMEYFLLGIPAVASDWPTMRRYFGDDVVRYVRPNDLEGLTEAVYELYRDPAKRAKQATAAREHFQNTLSWSRTKKDYLAVYGAGDSVASEEPGGGRQGRKTWIPFVLNDSRGPRNAISRLPTVINRFGFSPRKSLRNFDRLLEITDRYSVTPTLPVTAVTARRNPAVIRWLRDRGVEVAAHGFVHNDYASISAAEQLDQVAMARDEMSTLGFDVRGWRSPYSRWNADTVTALTANGFEYDASPVFAWPAFEQEQIEMNADAQAAYQRVRSLFSVRDASVDAVLPETVDGLVQIPMSIPQDEDMVDRLHLGPEEMSRVWLRVLADSRRYGEIFVICLHPERAALCAQPLDAALFEAKRKGDVWIAPLTDVAEWWKKRAEAELNVTADAGAGHWRVHSRAPDGVITRFGGTERQGSTTWEIESALKPVVYAGPEWSDATRTRIQEAGYAVEQNRKGPDGCAVVLSREFALEATPESIVRSLERRDRDLVRIQPWPAGFASCMSITGDIDALTLFDFAMRLKEFS